MAFGVLRFRLYPERYEWAFIDINGVVREEGGDACH
jgi:hypothetical protein